MALAQTSMIAHVRLSVSDIKRSKEFYDRLFGLPVAVDQSDHVGEPGVIDDPSKVFGGLIYELPSGALLGLRPIADGAPFVAERTGLDHLAFKLDDREALAAAKEALDGAGIECGDVTDLTEHGMAILSVQDPDGINLELTADL